MKRLFKILGALLFLGLLGIGIYMYTLNESKPDSLESSEADVLAQKMLTALNYEKYQNTRYLEWSFRGKNHYKWDKAMGKVQVTTGDTQVQLNLNKPNKSTVIIAGNEVNENEAADAIAAAHKNFNNDSFWLVAPYKVFDEGVTRSVADLEDDSKGLMVTYGSGGDTPGDSYLWKLNDSGFPESYKMWVKIIPVGGLEASWDDWIVVESGAFLPKTHHLKGMTLDMGEVKGYN